MNPEAEAIDAGRAWAEREFDALPDGASQGAWRSTWIDAMPLVHSDDDEARRALAEVCNRAAAQRWAEMTEAT